MGGLWEVCAQLLSCPTSHIAISGQPNAGRCTVTSCPFSNYRSDQCEHALLCAGLLSLLVVSGTLRHVRPARLQHQENRACALMTAVQHPRVDGWPHYLLVEYIVLYCPVPLQLHMYVRTLIAKCSCLTVNLIAGRNRGCG